MNKHPLIERLTEGNRRYRESADRALRERCALEGQRPWAIVICCSDSRVIPEEIFQAGLGELFVIRIAGNVLDDHQLGSVEYAAAHLGCKLVLLMGHTGCGAVAAAIGGEGHGYIGTITDEILAAIGEERDPLRACEKNVLHGVEYLKAAFAEHSEISGTLILGAVYDILGGELRFL